MLNMLRVENLSVIESATVEFGEGLNIITGETGAGKSVFIGALKLLLGERFARTLLRDEEKKLLVEGLFSGDFSHLTGDTREQFEIEDEVIIRREIDSAGKNRVYLNGKLATVVQLKEVAEGFADIHGQHEHQRLLNPACHIEFLDAAVDQKPKDAYLAAYGKYLEKKEEV
ncbi:MAG: AAA family ATPase [Geovibrio sp.]|nr:AAA family ATPase [Geovibrio sp.]